MSCLCVCLLGSAWNSYIVDIKTDKVSSAFAKQGHFKVIAKVFKRVTAVQMIYHEVLVSLNKCFGLLREKTSRQTGVQRKHHDSSYKYKCTLLHKLK